MIKFENYIIRPIENSDLALYFDLVERNRKRLEDFFTGTTSRTKSKEDTEVFLAEMIKRREAKTYFPFVLVNSETQDFIGFFDLKNIDWSIPKTEMGCYTDKDFTGKGITSKAMKYFVKYCFEKLRFKKIFLRTHESNKAMQIIAEKCGFEKEGVIRIDYKTTSGELIDLIYYGMLK
ncbi:GNAT family N-acetyltransferase [Aquimarina spongiae]|uniref:Ribosomal-protein-serine acetyltransferase n=1 Tax=Aquimarina spongiae TaxID=570521 RepID=A0A1M6HFL5_9FLAO|nr:GNAT family protein [Aquimarina spongiae]SHJ20933.1 ribosomal-protein-serine acetyltransferase [Aquimarina spongiae]